MSPTSVPADDARDCARHPMPSDQEMRMVKAIAGTAVREAVRVGAYQASFHGFHIYALRQPALFGVRVTVSIVFGVTWCMSDITFSLDALNSRSVLPASIHDKYLALQVKEPITCAQVM